MITLSRFYPLFIHKLGITYVNVDFSGFSWKKKSIRSVHKCSQYLGEMESLPYIYSGEKQRKGNTREVEKCGFPGKSPILWENIRFYLTLCQVFDINKNDVF